MHTFYMKTTGFFVFFLGILFWCVGVVNLIWLSRKEEICKNILAELSPGAKAEVLTSQKCIFFVASATDL